MLFYLSSLSLRHVCDPSGKLLASTSHVLALATFKDLNYVHFNVSIRVSRKFSRLNSAWKCFQDENST